MSATSTTRANLARATLLLPRLAQVIRERVSTRGHIYSTRRFFNWLDEVGQPWDPSSTTLCTGLRVAVFGTPRNGPSDWLQTLLAPPPTERNCWAALDRAAQALTFPAPTKTTPASSAEALRYLAANLPSRFNPPDWYETLELEWVLWEAGTSEETIAAALAALQGWLDASATGLHLAVWLAITRPPKSSPPSHASTS